MVSCFRPFATCSDTFDKEARPREKSVVFDTNETKNGKKGQAKTKEW